MSQASIRHLQLTGSFNFRDVGGYPNRDGQTVRWRRLYRSDALNRLTSEDLEILRNLGLLTLFDLRANAEVEEHGPGLPVEHHGPRHVHISFTNDEDTNVERLAEITDLRPSYAEFLDRGRESVRLLFEALADASNYPAVIHCAAGKDRTGVAIAIILRSLGVPDAVVVNDYALSDALNQEFVATLRAEGRTEFIDRVHPNLLRAQPHVMEYFLKEIDARFGSNDEFLAEAGISSDAVGAIKSQLLESNG